MKQEEIWRQRAAAFGEYLRAERKLAEMSLRDLAEQSRVSNAYLSQLERGLHQPSVRVVRSIANALGVPDERFLGPLGLVRDNEDEPATGHDTSTRADAVEVAIRSQTQLSEAQQDALIAVYHSYLDG